jgi:hypothetical protein
MPDGSTVSLKSVMPLASVHSPDVKAHVMKALASLSKFLDVYDDWLDLVKRHS